jgi:hypothetical protein
MTETVRKKESYGLSYKTIRTIVPLGLTNEIERPDDASGT